MSGRILIRFLAIIIAITGISGYAFYESRNLLRGPILTISTPQSGAVSNSPVTSITGQVENSVSIKMNDRDITTDPTGRFQEKFVLSEGTNVVKVAAVDRFGRTAEKYVQILYNEPGQSLTQRDSSQL